MRDLWSNVGLLGTQSHSLEEIDSPIFPFFALKDQTLEWEKPYQYKALQKEIRNLKQICLRRKEVISEATEE